MPSTRLITVGEAMLEAVINGVGETVVLLPAGSHHLSYLAPLAQQLAAAGFRTVAVNFRGVGASTGPVDGITLHHLAADVAGVIEALAVTPAHVVGHAFGSRVARCLAADRPELVRRVVLPAAGGLVPTDPEARRAAYRLRHETLTEAERLALQQAAYLSPASDPRLMAQVEKSPLWDEGDLTETVSQATPVAEWWAGGTAPILVVQGLDDRRAPPGNGWALRDQVGERMRVVDIPQAGHFLVLEQSHAVAEAVTVFLRER
jgi:pimeloyl-ACP methyl ester carboxylesterase